MNYTIKNLRFHPGHDAEGFSCDLYENGKKICQVIDDSWGGGYMYHKPTGGNLDIENRDNLDCIVGDLVLEAEIKLQEKKGIVFKTEYGFGLLQFNVQIPTILRKYANGLEHVQKAYDRAMKDGKEILNTEYLLSIGVTA